VENSRKQNTERLTAVWQNGGFSAKLKVSASKSATSPSCKTLVATLPKLRRINIIITKDYYI